MRDSITGQFALTSFREKYPTGRKHCSDCNCWRHTLDFTVHTWLDAAKTIPHKLMSFCKACAAARRRKRQGYERRNWYRLGVTGTEHWRYLKNAENRAKYLTLRQDPEWVARRRAYQRKRIVDEEFNMLGSGSGEYDAKSFVSYLDRYTTKLSHQHPPFINGVALSESDKREIYRWRMGEAKTIRLGTADAWSIRFDIPLWEIEQEAGRMAA